MPEFISITAFTRKEKYQQLLPQVKALLEGEEDLIASMASVCAALKTAFGFFWVGFYLVKNNDLVLGPFQGPVACTRITKGRGVCGASWQQKQTIIVPDVEQFPGHIACSSESRSEIVVPLLQEGEVRGVLDADSDRLNDFNETDQQFLEEICALLGGKK